MFPYKDNIPTSRSISPVTIGLIVVNLIIFLYELSLGQQLDGFLTQFALYGDAPAGLNLITYQFLHGGWLHVLGNMLYLWVFGNNIEDRLGPVWFLLFYLSSGVVGGITQSFFSADHALIIGASASVAGVMGAYLIWYPQAQIKVVLPIFFFFTIVTLPAFLVLLLWFITNLFSGFASITAITPSGVAYLGHIGGFLLGVLVAYFFARPKNQIYYTS